MTEVGWIPKDWEVKTLDEVGTFSKGRGVSRDQSHSGKLSCIRYGELYTSHENYIRAFYSFISQDVADTAKRLNKGDVLFAASGETKEEIGKTVAFVGTEEAYAGGDIIILSPKIESNSMFLGFVLNGEGAVRQKSALGQGDAVVHIHAPELARVCIPFPPNQEQSRIAEVLSDTYSLISSLSRTIEKKRLVKQGAMQQLLTGKTRLKGFDGEWVEMELGEFGNTIRGVGFTPEQSSSIKFANSIALFRSNNIQQQSIVLDDIIYVERDCVSERQIMSYGDILICTANGSRKLVGKSSMYRSSFQRTFGAFMCVFRCYDKCQSAFVSYLFQSDSYKKQLDEMLTGSAINNLNGSQIEALHFCIPESVEEQQAIANILTTMDDEIAALEAERDKYISIKQGMMQKLLTGEIRLPICQTTE